MAPYKVRNTEEEGKHEPTVKKKSTKRRKQKRFTKAVKVEKKIKKQQYSVDIVSQLSWPFNKK